MESRCQPCLKAWDLLFLFSFIPDTGLPLDPESDVPDKGYQLCFNFLFLPVTVGQEFILSTLWNSATEYEIFHKSLSLFESQNLGLYRRCNDLCLCLPHFDFVTLDKIIDAKMFQKMSSIIKYKWLFIIGN